jgi:hypothetical protein
MNHQSLYVTQSYDEPEERMCVHLRNMLSIKAIFYHCCMCMPKEAHVVIDVDERLKKLEREMKERLMAVPSKGIKLSFLSFQKILTA